MPSPRLLLTALALVALATPAVADPSSTDISWAALDPGDDWAAVVIKDLFPIWGAPASGAVTPGAETAVIQKIVGQFTGFVSAIACAFVAYNVIMHIHRAAESSRLLGNGQSWMFVVRAGFAGVMMFPVAGGFSAGQMLVAKGALTGIGMARVVYNNAVKAIGPDALTIATPMIPGTREIVAGLIDDELCMDVINLASNTAGGTPLVPIPKAYTQKDTTGGYTAYLYTLSTGNSFGDPTCGSVTIKEPLKNVVSYAGVSIDMSAVQKAVLNSVLTGTIRNQVAAAAADFWKTRKTSALVPLSAALSSGVAKYTAGLAAAATATQSAIQNALRGKSADMRQAGLDDPLAGQVAQSSLGWTSAGAYYLEIAKLNAATLSLLSAVPQVTAPTYQGLSRSLSYDIAPLVVAVKDYTEELRTQAVSMDGSTAPTGVPRTLGNNQRQGDGATALERVFGELNLTSGLMTAVTGYLMPGAEWTDPFGSLMTLGQTLINSSLAAMGAAALMSSTTASSATAIWSTLTFNWAGAAAAVVGNLLMSFLATPIFMGLLALLVPGVMIAYVLPMIPWVMWMAGVMGWLILVCEAMIAVPLWMLAHMTVGGDGLHGRGIEGWGLLFNVVFRPTLMVIGLFLGYFVFAAMSWLIRQSFGVAAGYVLESGWLVSNFVGMCALLMIFVSTHVMAAMMSFRMVALLPHHLPRLIGLSSGNRVDVDSFQQQAAWGPGAQLATGAKRALAAGSQNFGDRQQGRLPGRGPSKYLTAASAPSSEGKGDGGLDSTLNATSSS